MKQAIRLMIVDDHTAVRQAFSSILQESGFPVISEASNGKEAIEALNHAQPDVVLMDLDMPVMNGFEALAVIRRDFPAVKVIILSGHAEKSYITHTLQSGADAFLPKQCSIEVVIDVIESVYNNKPFVYEKAVGSSLPSYFVNPKPKQSEEQRALTDEEIRILIMICQGKNRIAIAAELESNVRTIAFHTENIYKKTLLSNKVALLKYAIRHGYISLTEPVSAQ